MFPKPHGSFQNHHPLNIVITTLQSGGLSPEDQRGTARGPPRGTTLGDHLGGNTSGDHRGTRFINLLGFFKTHSCVYRRENSRVWGNRRGLRKGYNHCKSKFLITQLRQKSQITLLITPLWQNLPSGQLWSLGDVTDKGSLYTE